ncbi:MAG: FtsQ-type POTRA domain-containing protein [Verrucomicrobia bacterium]|nr:MAG: FtsQ-type POTRA domain-containing protein [Verrucomicrobiota bacterium]
MNTLPILPQTAPTWREAIPQNTAPRPRGRTGRSRLLLNAVVKWTGLAALGAFLVFGYIAWQTWKINPAMLASPVSSEPLRTILVQTDGVLNQAWVERTLRIPAGAELMTLDLASLHARLLRSGQVTKAVVARRLPGTLVVTLEERSPILRVPEEAGRPLHSPLRLVARDGFVFVGENYDDSLVSSLPLLAGAHPIPARDGAGFELIQGMAAVSDLLSTARSSAPSLARDFQVISVARQASDGLLLVTIPGVAQVIFGGNESFYPQLARLDYLLDELRARGHTAPIRYIDLSLGPRQVPVAYEASTATPPAPSTHSSSSLPRGSGSPSPANLPLAHL